MEFEGRASCPDSEKMEVSSNHQVRVKGTGCRSRLSSIESRNSNHLYTVQYAGLKGLRFRPLKLSWSRARTAVRSALAGAAKARLRQAARAALRVYSDVGQQGVFCLCATPGRVSRLRYSGGADALGGRQTPAD